MEKSYRGILAVIVLHIDKCVQNTVAFWWMIHPAPNYFLKVKRKPPGAPEACHVIEPAETSASKLVSLASIWAPKPKPCPKWWFKLRLEQSTSEQEICCSPHPFITVGMRTKRTALKNSILGCNTWHISCVVKMLASAVIHKSSICLQPSSFCL